MKFARSKPGSNGAAHRKRSAARGSNGMEQPSPNHRPLTELVAELTRYLELLQKGMRQRVRKSDASWAKAATAGLNTALEELRVTQEELEVARDEAQNQRQHYYDLFHWAPDAYFITDQHGKITQANAAAARMLNMVDRYLVGKPLMVFVDSIDVNTFYRAIHVMVEQVIGTTTAHPTHRMVNENECMLVLHPRGEGKPVRVHCRLSAVRGWDRGLVEIRWLVRDITNISDAQDEIIRNREQLKALAAEVLQVEQRERRRIAEGIHDNAVQTLALANMTLSSALRGVQEPQAATLREAGRLMSQAMQELRVLIFDLAPPVLYELGLGPGVEWLADQFAQRHNLPIEVRNDLPSNFVPPEWRSPLFQSVRELLINALKHAHATRVTVTLRASERGTRICVIDNGRGIPKDVRPYASSGGFGLFSLRNRLEHLGAKLRIRSRPGRGTWAKILVPPPPTERDNR